MADLIDRQAARKKLLGEVVAKYPCSFYVGLSAAAAELDKLPAVDAVSRGVYDQIKWERDVAIEQLAELGIGFGAKVPDMVEVGACEGCIFSNRKRPQKCSCCRRNKDLKDCYERREE